jgi:integrase
MTGFIVSVFRFRNRVSSKEAFEGLELGEGKPSRPVLRGPGGRKAARLLGMYGPPLCRKGLRFHDLRHTAATKLLEQGTPIPVVAQILGWSASTAVRMAKRYGHIRPEVQRQAVATDEIQAAVNQIVHQAEREVEFKLPN